MSTSYTPPQPEKSEALAAKAYGPSAVFTPANLVSITRILIAPLAFFLLVREQSSWTLLGLWFVLAFSDQLDGVLARKQGPTRLGAFLDPLADKVLVIGGWASLAMANRFAWWLVVITVVREITVSLFRSRYVRQGLAVPASKTAKYKTFFQLGAVGWVTLPWTTDMHWLADSFAYISVGLALVSMGQYLRAGSRVATNMEQ